MKIWRRADSPPSCIKKEGREVKSEEIILESYVANRSIRATAKDTGYSWQKVVKSLSNKWVVINDTHRLILDAYESGMSINGIAKQLGITPRTVRTYLPRVRPVPGESTTINARRVRECRERKREKRKE